MRCGEKVQVRWQGRLRRASSARLRRTEALSRGTGDQFLFERGHGHCVWVGRRALEAGASVGSVCPGTTQGAEWCAEERAVWETPNSARGTGEGFLE